MEQVPKADWWPRAGAMLIDALILSALALVVGIVVSGSGSSSDDATLAIYGVVIMSSMIYSPVLMARAGAGNGQTVGKKAMGLRVVHASGTPMTLSRGLVRDGLGKTVLGLVPLYTIVDSVWPLFDPAKQALHDKIGKTYVVLANVVPATATAEPQDTLAPAPHDAWSAPSQPVPPARPRAGSHDAPPAPPVPPSAPRERDPQRAPVPSGEVPDLGGFAPPVPPTPAAPPRRPDDEDVRGPFGPSHD